MTLEVFNRLSVEEAREALSKCCHSQSWVTNLEKERPFATTQELLSKAAKIWYETTQKSDYLEAFAGHPKIGDAKSLKEKYASTAKWANNEQSSVAVASDETIGALAAANEQYEAKFGYIFIVSATGKSADEMLALIERRLTNEAETELSIAMNEQHKITVIRLAKLIEDIESQGGAGRSHLTTHALDTMRGVPAGGMIVQLWRSGEGEDPRCISLGRTNQDGRVGDVLPPGYMLPVGAYTMTFETKAYHEANEQPVFYPKATIEFMVTSEEHYHIPLLISPYGYTTYRGS